MISTTRDRILNSAEELFAQLGLNGVKMQDLADHASVNKGLLHYYFKSKEKLFQEVFERTLATLFEGVSEVFENPENSTYQKVELLVHLYFETFSQKPKLILFFLSEVNRDPTLLKTPSFKQRISGILSHVQSIVPQNKPPVFVFHFLLTLVSLVAFPFIARPVFHQLAGDFIDPEEVIKDRKSFAIHTLKNMLHETDSPN